MLTYMAIEWGQYDLNLNTFGKPGPQELHEFIQKLDGEASWATTRAGILEKLMGPFVNTKGMGKGRGAPLEVAAQIPVAFEATREDVIQLDSEADLCKQLQQGFSKPLFYRASQASDSVNGRALSFERFRDVYRVTPDKQVNVYDYSQEKVEDRTRLVTIGEMFSHWEKPHTEKTALNFLDLKNETLECCPPPLRQFNALECVARHKSTTSRTTVYSESYHQEFFLASEANAISTIHIDTGGQVTWIMILEGRKLWYFARGCTPDHIGWLGGLPNTRGVSARVGARGVAGW